MYTPSLVSQGDSGTSIAAPESDGGAVMIAVARNREQLQFEAPEWRADREVGMAAIGRDGNALQFAAPERPAEREVALAAVSKSWDTASQFAAPELGADREFVNAAVAKAGSSTTIDVVGSFLQVDSALQRGRRDSPSVDSPGPTLVEPYGNLPPPPPPTIEHVNLRLPVKRKVPIKREPSWSCCFDGLGCLGSPRRRPRPEEARRTPDLEPTHGHWTDSPIGRILDDTWKALTGAPVDRFSVASPSYGRAESRR